MKDTALRDDAVAFALQLLRNQGRAIAGAVRKSGMAVAMETNWNTPEEVAERGFAMAQKIHGLDAEGKTE